jgi:hypothetical protein
VEPTSVTYPTCKAILSYESCIGNVTCQEDVLLSSVSNHDSILQIVKHHRRELKIAAKGNDA